MRAGTLSWIQVRERLQITPRICIGTIFALFTLRLEREPWREFTTVSKGETGEFAGQGLDVSATRSGGTRRRRRFGICERDAYLKRCLKYFELNRMAKWSRIAIVSAPGDASNSPALHQPLVPEFSWSRRLPPTRPSRLPFRDGPAGPDPMRALHYPTPRENPPLR